MDRTAALLIASAIGGVLAAQAPLNSALGRTVGGVQASVVALGISFVALLALALLAGGFSGIGRLGEAGGGPPPDHRREGVRHRPARARDVVRRTRLACDGMTQTRREIIQTF